jgi:replicative DNA helicase
MIIKRNVPIETVFNFDLCYLLFNNKPVSLPAVKNILRMTDKLNTIEGELFRCREHGITDKDLIIHTLNKKYPKIEIDFIIKNIANRNINEETEKLLIDFIETKGKEDIISNYTKNIVDLANKLIEVDMNSSTEINDSFFKLIDRINHDIMKVTTTDDYIGNNTIINRLNDLKEKIQSIPKIKTPIQLFNNMLNGGFEHSRLYMFLASAKCWKSGLLLNIALWGKQHKGDYGNKKPVILYITMENTEDETIERIYTHYMGDNDCFENIDKFEKLYKQGNELLIKYYPNRSINTSQIDRDIAKIESFGDKKVIMVVHDYIKRIKSVEPLQHDIRLELGAVTNEFAVIARKRRIPFITASQLNRQAMQVIGEASNNGNNATSSLNSSHIGESALMIENVDCGYIINPDTFNNKKFLSIKQIISRVKTGSIQSFTHPFKNGMCLEEDIDKSKPIGFTDYKDLIATYDPNRAMVDKNKSKSNNKSYNPPGALNLGYTPKSKQIITDDDSPF